ISSSGSKLNEKFCPELLNLIVYCRTSSIPGDLRDLPLTDMISFDENKAKCLMLESQRSQLLAYHRSRLSRVYPKASRMDSSNFHPINSHFWSSGAQLLALNFQTPGDEVHANQAWFSKFASKGYILKPKIL
ncbi:Phosphoinositide phospholipase C, partial [Caligus rogercresseyi]